MDTRLLLAKVISPVMKLTGFRFSKDYRWGVTAWHRAVYRLIDVVAANHAAGWDIPKDVRMAIEKADREACRGN